MSSKFAKTAARAFPGLFIVGFGILLYNSNLGHMSLEDAGIFMIVVGIGCVALPFLITRVKISP